MERRRRLFPAEGEAVSHVEATLGAGAPIVAASNYVRAVPGMIAPYVGARMTILGTDGFCRSASRPALRRFFEVDRQHVVIAALESLVRGEASSQSC